MTSLVSGAVVFADSGVDFATQLGEQPGSSWGAFSE